MISLNSKRIYEPRVKQFEFIKKEKQMLSGTSNIRSNICKKTFQNPNSGSLIDSFIFNKKVKKNN